MPKHPAHFSNSCPTCHGVCFCRTRAAALEEAAKTLEAWAAHSVLDEEAAEKAIHFASVIRDLKKREPIQVE